MESEVSKAVKGPNSAGPKSVCVDPLLSSPGRLSFAWKEMRAIRSINAMAEENADSSEGDAKVLCGTVAQRLNLFS